MARISGVDIPRDKRIVIALTYIYGIGKPLSERILTKAEIDHNKRTHQLTDDEVNRIRTIIENEHKVEGPLRTEITMNIKRLMDLGSYRGLRHRKSLPVRGQRTSTNARTRKGPKRAAVKKKTKAGKK